MTKIDIFSGFLGAGKTTLIKKLVAGAYGGEKVVIIENEFGEIGIDSGFLKESGIMVNELNSGCICCSLVGDFSKALHKVMEEYSPDRIVIEPSGVGKLSDVVKAVLEADLKNACINCTATVVDAGKCKMYMKNFGEFFNDQIENAKCIVFSHTEKTDSHKVANAVSLVKEHNPHCVVVTTPWDELDAEVLLQALEGVNRLQEELHELSHHHKHNHECECGHHHEHDHECECGHHHEHDHECECGHHHEHDHECECGHHHEHDHECECGHHHHHHADEVFTSWGAETVEKYTKQDIEEILCQLSDSSEYGTVLRAKGIVKGEDGEWLHFDYVPDGVDVRTGTAEVTGRVCVIGSHINEEEITKLFKI